MRNLLMLSVFITNVAWSQDTGNFEIYKNNFKEIYNKYRVAQPKITPWAGSFFPYSDNGTAVKLNPEGNEVSRGGVSPMETYGFLAGIGSDAHEWEKQNHSCEPLKGDLKKSCNSWWGHCNGWSAAAIKEAEPREAVTLRGRTLSVADQKGIYTELWLSSGSLNAGLTDKEKKTGKWVFDHENPTDAYRMFWDVNPRSFFLIFTNYIGAEKTGLVVDRFTGDEVWNQPVVGYRLLPLRPEDITEVDKNGRKYWSAKIRMKFYWANDLGTPAGHVSRPFDINTISDEEEVEFIGEDYEGRLLAFRLNFDAPVVVSADGKTVESAGKIVGNGLWDHQENAGRLSPSELNSTHPDFIWLPTDPIQDYNGYGNPFLEAKVVAKISRGERVAAIRSQKLKLVFSTSVFAFTGLTPEEIKKVVTKVIRREGIRHVIYLNEIEVSDSKVAVSVRFPAGAEDKALSSLFRAAGIDVTVEN